MPTPRRSARVAAQDTSPDYTDPPESGRKRKSDATGSSPSAKRGKKAQKKEEKEQKTIEDTMDIDEKEDPQPEAKESNDSAPTQPAPAQKEEERAPEAVAKEPEQPSISHNEPKPEPQPAESHAAEPEPQSEQPKLVLQQAPKPEEPKPAPEEPKPAPEPAQKPAPESQPQQSWTTDATPDPGIEPMEDPRHVHTQPQPQPPEPAPKAPENATASSEQPRKDEKTEAPPPSEKEEPHALQDTSNSFGGSSIQHHSEPQPTAHQANGDAIIPKVRDDDVPSSILEKGIIYFFFRPRVNIDQPQDVQDIARSYFVLRPLPHGAKLGDGPIGDGNNSRLIALPKKVLPLSGKDRFMAFVEKAQSSFAVLKTDFMSASDYATKTAGTSHSPPVTPVAEGVYAITTTGRESHLAYMTTIPSQLGEVQKDVGIKESGSFVVSAKNPKYPGPANTNIGKDPGYPEEIKQEFRDLRWMPLQPKLLDYVGTQFLLIGESSGIEKATEQLPRDEKQDKDTPLEEIEKLEGEDEIRVKHLKGDDTVFMDLGISKKEFPPVPTTW